MMWPVTKYPLEQLGTQSEAAPHQQEFSKYNALSFI